MKIFKLTILIFVCVALGVFWFFKNQTHTAQINFNGVKIAQEETVQINQRQEINPVSLPALMQKTFDGDNLTLGKILDDNNNYTRYYITYTGSGLKISGIMNIPKGEPPLGGFPVLVLNHGHIDTSIYTNGRGLKREQDYLAKQGFAVIHPDYRNHAESDKDPNAETSLRLGYVEDVINAIYALKNSKLDFINKDKIGMLGHSMGGGVALNTMVVKPNLIKAFVLYAPVSSNYEENFERWTKRNSELVAKITELYGQPTENPEFWKDVSAINFFNNIKAPVLIFHGTNDSSVPYQWSQTLLTKLIELKKDVRLVTYEGEAHEFIPKWPDFMKQTSEFFKTTLN